MSGATREGGGERVIRCNIEKEREGVGGEGGNQV